MTAPDPTTDGAAAPPDPVVSALAAVTGSLAGGGEERPGQVTMAQAVAKATADDREMVVKAGTGTGE